MSKYSQYVVDDRIVRIVQTLLTQDHTNNRFYGLRFRYVPLNLTLSYSVSPPLFPLFLTRLQSYMWFFAYVTLCSIEKTTTKTTSNTNTFRKTSFSVSFLITSHEILSAFILYENRINFEQMKK